MANAVSSRALLARHTAHMPSTHATPATRSHTHRNSSCTKVSGRTSKTVITARHVLQSCADMVKPLAPGQLAMPICRATLQARGPPRPSAGHPPRPPDAAESADPDTRKTRVIAIKGRWPISEITLDMLHVSLLWTVHVHSFSINTFAKK